MSQALIISEILGTNYSIERYGDSILYILPDTRTTISIGFYGDICINGVYRGIMHPGDIRIINNVLYFK